MAFLFANEQHCNFSAVVAFSNIHLLQNDLMLQNTIISVLSFHEIMSLANFEILSRDTLKWGENLTKRHFNLN